MPRRRVVLVAAAAAVVLALVAAVLLATRGSDGESSAGAVPTVTGLEQRVAEERLVDKGYSTQIVRVTSPLRVPGTVIGQRPAGGTDAARGTVVELTVAARTAAGTTNRTETQAEGEALTMPRVVGRHQILAGADLEQLGLVVDTYPVASTATCGVVVAQEPAPGRRVARGSTIRLSVSLGPDPLPVSVVPGLLGEESKMRQAAREFGFTVRTETRRAPQGVLRGQVFAQRPAALSEARELTQLTIVVAS